MIAFRSVATGINASPSLSIKKPRNQYDRLRGFYKKARALAVIARTRAPVFLRGHGSGYIQDHHHPEKFAAMTRPAPFFIMAGTYRKLTALSIASAGMKRPRCQ
jgi:hypothetical protein